MNEYRYMYGGSGTDADYPSTDYPTKENDLTIKMIAASARVTDAQLDDNGGGMWIQATAYSEYLVYPIRRNKGR